MTPFVAAYIECALWSSVDDHSDPLDNKYSLDDIAPETLACMTAECEAFQVKYADLLAQAGGKDSQHGHDLWLTRNGHGAGFWDRDYPEPVGAQLTLAAHQSGYVDLYVGDDGKIYQM